MKKGDMELIFSPDDNGWYYQKLLDWEVSQLFKTKREALNAKKENQLIWT